MTQLKVRVLGAKTLTVFAFLFICQPSAWAASTTILGSEGYTVYTGIPVQQQSLVLHVHGKEIQVTEIVTNLHIMNVPGGRQPVDFRSDFMLAEDAQIGQTKFCKSSFTQTVADEKNSKSADHSLAVFQISIDRTFSSVLTDEGYSVVPDQAVNCWEVVDPQ